jgi:hypothetical protein
MRKSVFNAGLVLLCLGFAINVFLFFPLSGGPGNRQPFDWGTLISFAPAYLPWKIPIILYAVGFVLMVAGLAARPRR